MHAQIHQRLWSSARVKVERSKFRQRSREGNCLAVYIKAIVPRGPQPVGTTALIPEFGGLVGTTATALLNAGRICAEDRGHGRGRRQMERQNHVALSAVHRASRIAYCELIRWIEAEFGFDETDAYLLLTMLRKMRLGNMVDPKYTLGASIAKSIVAAHRS
jgi:acetamidase/formamidase